MEIREGICTTVGQDGSIHHAAMGVQQHANGWAIRPYPETRTLANLIHRPEADAWISFVDEALPLVMAALGMGDALSTAGSPPLGYWVGGAVSVAHVRVVQVTAPTAQGKPYSLSLAVINEELLKPYHGVTRAYGALVEAAIVATRIRWLGVDALHDALTRAETLIDKTGTAADRQAYEILRQWAEGARRE